MELISDILLGSGAWGACAFWFVLSKRLNALNTLENGMGGAIAVLSAQVDDMTKALEAAQKTASESARTLTALTSRAEESAQRLELLLASLHDLPEAGQAERRRLRATHSRARNSREAA
ncbi:MAG: hypothetical protein WBH04_08915 [Albidovulum sp.]